MLRTGICAQFYGTPPRFAFIRPQGVENEIRQSLMLTEPESCEAVLNDACAFDLQLTYRPVEENAAELSARDAIVNRAILSTLTLPDLTRSFTCMPSELCSPAPVKCRAEMEIFLPA